MVLDHVNAPQTVANFIRLAQGTSPWVDYKTGAVKWKPYYNGVTFHRVVAGAYSQTGSRTGDGADGPGYNFRDEFGSGSHAGPYLVSMVSSGPNTNGAQFLITAATQTQLNGVNSVFGLVILYDAPGDDTSDTSVGRRVCNAINTVPVDDVDRPLADVVIQAIKIRREGFSAKSFNEHLQGLPKLWALWSKINHQGDQVNLKIQSLPGNPVTLTRYSYSSNLMTWQSVAGIYRDADDGVLSEFDVSAIAAGQDKLFFYVSQVVYDDTQPLWPKDLTGRALSVLIPELASQWGTTTTFTFTSESGGTMSNAKGSGTFLIAHLENDGLGSLSYIKASMKYSLNGNSCDVRLRLRLGQDVANPAYFQGRHSGTIYLEKNGTVKAEWPTRGTMMLTR